MRWLWQQVCGAVRTLGRPIRCIARGVTMARAGAVLTLVGPLAMMLAGYGWEGGLLALASGLATAILSRLPDLAEIGAWGFSAKLQRAEAVAERAEMTAKQLRAFALPLARMSLGLAISSGRWGGTGAARATTRRLVDDLLASLAATDAERREAYLDWRAWEHFDAANAVGSAIKAAAETGQANAVVAAVRPLTDHTTLRVAPVSAFKDVAERFDGASSPGVVQALASLAEAAAADVRPDKHEGVPPAAAQ